MEYLSQQDNTIFLGQAVGCPGTAVFNTLKDIDLKKRLELPVFEETQTGISIGLSLNGFVPITIYPRWNFLLLGINQLVNHLDKYPLMSSYKPKIICRVVIGSERPLHPNRQHVGDFTEPFKSIFQTINIVRLDEPEQIFPAYKKAYEQELSTILVEWGDYYNEK